MHTDLKLALTHLAKGELLPLRNGLGKGIAVFDGDVWITQEADPQDHVLAAGESFVFDKGGHTVAQALSDARVLVFDVDARPFAAAPAPVPVPAAAALEAARERLAARMSIDWYLETRRQRAHAIGSAIASGWLALGQLWARLRRSAATATASGATPARHAR
jgi:Protein of unknown function (DUF2917)